MKRFARPSAGIAALALLTAAAAAGCGSATSGVTTGNAGAFGKLPPAASGPQHAGTVTWAETPGFAPTWIMPIYTSAADAINNINQFEYLMWRPLYWFSNGVEPTQTTSMNLAGAPVWSDGDKTVTITLKSNYKWSNGMPLTSQDVLFWFDEVKAAVAENAANFGSYSPGVGIPDEVASVTAPTSSTFVVNLKESVNPSWFWDDELSLITPMPSAEWAKASATGPLLNFAVPANAKKIFDYLTAASGTESTYATNPLWQTVDGPYRLTAFNSSTGAFTMVPNNSYGGPHVAKMSTLQAVTFTSDTAEFDAVRAGDIDVGYVPLVDMRQIKTVELGGYHVYGYPGFSFNYIAYNFIDTTGDFNKIIAQLYVRQALAHLQDEAGYIKAFFGGAGGQAYGPVPSVPTSPYTPADAETDPYPYSIPAAISLLKNHGWTVHPGGTDVCAKAGTGPADCGAGIPVGTKLAFNLIYSTTPGVIGEQCTALASAARQAGITVNLSSSNFNYIITYYDDAVPSSKSYDNKWATEDYGGFTDPTYPTTIGVFNGPGAENEGDYNSATANSLINASVSSGNPSAVKAEASYLTENQPGLFQPNFDWVTVWKTNLSGAPASFANETQSYLTPEYWYFTK
jgi:peptide/nickel transport system substrate-binding protein